MATNAVTGEIVATEFQEMDRFDEDQILAELRGEVLTSYVYSFRQGGKDITGLSWAGVKAVAAKMGAVGIEMLQLFESDAAWVCVVRATGPDGSSRIGATTQTKLMKSGDKMIDDPFVLPKAVSKAQRNAIRALLPETLVLEVIKMAQERNQFRPAQPQENAPRQPAPVDINPNAPPTRADLVAQWSSLVDKAYNLSVPIKFEVIPDDWPLDKVGRIVGALAAKVREEEKRQEETRDAVAA